MDTAALVRRYYDCFNARDIEGMLGLLAPDVLHEISQGGSEVGQGRFRAFMERMNRCYRERAYELAVMTDGDGRAAAEFMLDGSYTATDGAFPPAGGQTYTLRVGAFFEVRGGKIARVSNHYNLKTWLQQIGS